MPVAVQAGFERVHEIARAAEHRLLAQDRPCQIEQLRQRGELEHLFEPGHSAGEIRRMVQVPHDRGIDAARFARLRIATSPRFENVVANRANLRGVRWLDEPARHDVASSSPIGLGVRHDRKAPRRL
jgi:hypothetical protein